MTGLIPRREVFDTYWYFAYERLEMMYQRIEGKSILTDDEILSRYKFCNTFRICDRVTQYLVREVQYPLETAKPFSLTRTLLEGLAPSPRRLAGEERHSVNDKSPALSGEFSNEDLVLRTILFRLFSWPDTWEEIEQFSGGLNAKTFNFDGLTRVLDARFKRGGKVYTSAFILSGNDAFFEGRKHRNHLRLVEKMVFNDGLAAKIQFAKSLSEVYELLIAYPMIGRFLAYQIAVDLNYSTLINFEESSFVMAGPGAARGIGKCFVSIGNNSLEEVIMYMVENQEEHFARLCLPFGGLYGRKLQAIDCQGLFCETDKYSRVKFPELVSNRIRIKTMYRPGTKPRKLFFPPKWLLS